MWMWTHSAIVIRPGLYSCCQIDKSPSIVSFRIPHLFLSIRRQPDDVEKLISAISLQFVTHLTHLAVPMYLLSSPEPHWIWIRYRTRILHIRKASRILDSVKFGIYTIPFSEIVLTAFERIKLQLMYEVLWWSVCKRKVWQRFMLDLRRSETREWRLTKTWLRVIICRALRKVWWGSCTKFNEQMHKNTKVHTKKSLPPIVASSGSFGKVVMETLMPCEFG